MALMANQHMLDDGKPEAGASRGGAAALVDAVEALGQARQVDRVDAVPVIFHLDQQALVIRLPAQGDMAVFGGVAHRIEDQIRDRAAQLLLLTAQRQAGIGLDGEGVAPLGQAFGVVADMAEQGAHVDAATIVGQFVGFQA